ncbi:MAG: hypothetical protein ACFE94_13135 [Candidatus Hodarchaeota archaeon]
MTQTYQKIMIMKRPKVEENQALLGDLNPRYFEEAIHLKEAKDQIHACVGSKYDLFSVF